MKLAIDADDGDAQRFLLISGEQWARIKPLLPKNTRGMPRVDEALGRAVAQHEHQGPLVLDRRVPTILPLR